MINKVLTGIAVAFTLTVGASCAEAATFTLYNGSGLPANQGWLTPGAVNSSGVPVTPSQTIVSGGVQVNTSANNAKYSGYTNYNPLNSSFINPTFPTLDQNSGYSIFFNASLNTTTDASDTRATFNVIAIGANNQGIELGFDANRIFAQNNNFTRGETTGNFNTSANVNYELRVQGNNYQLFANNSSILTGSLRNYQFNPMANNPPLGFNPYQIPSFLFFGDNTGQAFGKFTLRSASVNTPSLPLTANRASVAEPSSPVSLFGLGMLGLASVTFVKLRRTIRWQMADGRW